MLLESCEGGGHQRKAPGKQLQRRYAGDDDHRPRPTSVRGRRNAHACGEEVAEAAETRAPYVHADVGDRVVAKGKEILRAINARLNTELVRGCAEERGKLPDEMKGRHAGFPRYCLEGERRIVHFTQQVACAAQTKKRVSREHRSTVYASEDRLIARRTPRLNHIGNASSCAQLHVRPVRQHC